MRSPIPREDDFRSRLRSPAVAARVGLWLGICFGVAFVTGDELGLATDLPPSMLATTIRTITMSAPTPTSASQSRRGSVGGLARVRSDRRTTPV